MLKYEIEIYVEIEIVLKMSKQLLSNYLKAMTIVTSFIQSTKMGKTR